MTSTFLTISSIVIHEDTEGRYSLNDLHKAAGGERRHRPVYWLELQQTKELIEEIIKVGNPTFTENTQICVIKPITTRRGCKGGTYVCKELVYSYAMWISAAFALQVIRAYDKLVSGQKEHPVSKTTVDERTPLRDAINMLVSKKHLLYPEAYALIHQRFNIEHIDALPADKLPEAIEYVHRLALEGEYLPKQPDAHPVPSIPLKGVIALYLDNSEVVRSEFLPEGVTIGTLDHFESLVRHRGGIVLWDDMQQREFVRERAMARL